jgi:NhaA family Na+:H+ antiporter
LLHYAHNERGLTRLLRPFQIFLRQESRSGVLLFAAAVLALVLSNSQWGWTYRNLWDAEILIGIGAARVPLVPLHVINDGLMTIFFLVVGLEIKREMTIGELSTMRQALLPILAALGGMIVPACLYLAMTHGTGAVSGWGIPMATDIAFSLGVLTLLGNRIPTQLKVFLTALAIVDDIGAVIVIAVFYASSLAWSHILVAVVILAVLAFLNWLGVRSFILYTVLGVGLWVALLDSGIHATIAGVLLAMAIPARGKQDEVEDTPAEIPYVQRMEEALHPWVTYGIVPLFALANAGVTFEHGVGSLLQSNVALGVFLGLAVGKQAGITLFSWAAVKAGVATLPLSLSWRQIYGAGWLGGIGFTMSIFIANLAFGLGPSADLAKGGIYVASLFSGIGGLLVLQLSTSQTGKGIERN